MATRHPSTDTKTDPTSASKPAAPEGTSRPEVGARPPSGRSRAPSQGRRNAEIVSAPENIASRAFQAFILILGVMLMFAFFFGLEWGLVIVGLLVFISAFPPMRRAVDRWLVGVSRGPEADQAAIIRIAGGVVITLLGLIIALT